MAIGLFLLLIAVGGLAGFVFWVWSLVDAIQRPDGDWEQAQQNKLVWILLLVFTGAIGSFIYVLVARPALEEAKRGF